MDGAAQTRESSLKFMTRALACMADGQGFATASVEGRIAVEYFDPSQEAQDKKYAFKCHRRTINDVDHVWPVNALAFHPIYNTFASAGSDGTVSIWDHKLKKRLRLYNQYHSAVPSIDFSCDGTKLAVGVSYNWDDGEEGSRSAERPSVFIRTVGDEVKTSYIQAEGLDRELGTLWPAFIIETLWRCSVSDDFLKTVLKIKNSVKIGYMLLSNTPVMRVSVKKSSNCVSRRRYAVSALAYMDLPIVETFGDVIQDALAAPPKADMLPGAHGPEALLHEKLAALPPDHPFRVAFASLSSDVRVGQALQKLQDNINNSRGQADRDVSDTGSLRLLLQSATQFNSLPDSYYLHGVVLVSKKVVGSGAFGDVYRGKWGEKDVALKVLRVLDFQSGYATLLREIIIWRQLSHPNIQPFLGVDSQLFPSRLAVASKWEGNGSVKIAMRTFQAHVLDTLRPAWIIDTAQGLKYLHDNYIVHGDLRGDNILITEDRHARLTDFGLTSLADSTTRTMGTRSGKAPFAWAAPELSEDLKHPNFACDVYSFAYIQWGQALCRLE
ncbi:hypothetical protein EUX98_g5114 [Antrodiella citrinella]|uniref:Protein kinase domain-containing protein n=1 Tax=Antrodiella citrinella TaxID=2447956 RepID=A0A4S4MUU5_9APHY|nr:hypothetical protein EUX98_g5114 [Antrodiella citrinella]